MPRCRTKVPHDRFIILWEEGETSQLIHRPGADMRGSDVTHVVHVEAQQRTHLGFLEQLLDACQSLIAQPFEVYTLFPIHTHQAICFNSHQFAPSGWRKCLPGSIDLRECEERSPLLGCPR